MSIILLTYNGMPLVEKTVAMIMGQDYSGAVEVVHIDSGSTDGTLRVVGATGIEPHLIDRSEFGHSKTRNLGAALANNEILVFVTQDAVPLSRDWLRILVAPFRDHEVGGVYGRQIAPKGIGPLRAYALERLYPHRSEIRYLRAGDRLSLNLIRFSDANAAVRADLCRRFMFDEKALVCEDHGMCRDLLKAHFKIIYEPKAAVMHGHERTVKGEFVWALQNGISLNRMGILSDPSIGGELMYGVRKLGDEWVHFVRRRRYTLALKSLLINLVKWCGVQLGKHVDNLPHFLKVRILESI